MDEIAIESEMLLLEDDVSDQPFPNEVEDELSKLVTNCTMKEKGPSKFH